MLYFCAFGGELVPVLVDAIDQAAAAEMAGKVADGVRPSSVIPIVPGMFVAQLFVEEEDETETACAPLDHVVAFLSHLDESTVDSVRPEVPIVVECGDVAEFQGEDLSCDLPHGHGGVHRGSGPDGSVAEWDGGE